MHLHELLGWPGPMTHRQFLAWHWWLEDELNNPGRLEHYLMRVAFECRHAMRRMPRIIDLEPFKVRFGKKKGKKGLPAAVPGAKVLTKEMIAKMDREMRLYQLKHTKRGSDRGGAQHGD